MKATKISIIVLTATVIAACSASKKAGNTSRPSASETPVAMAKSADGIYEPGAEELSAIQSQFANANMAQLNEGYVLYTKGACIDCHGAKNIYKRAASRWQAIIDDMAQRARLSSIQKEAVYRYVLAIKSTQAKELK